MTELEEAVSALTDPIITNHEGQYIVQVPLLTQLENAKYSNTNHGGGGGSKSGRSVLNSDVMELAAHLHTEAHSWARIAGLPAQRASTIDTLRRWVAAAPDAGEFFITQLNKRRKQIINLLNPVGKFEYATACPITDCQAATWFDLEGTERPRPLIATYAKDNIESVRVECRACGAEWEGAGVGELIEEVESKTRAD